MCGDCGALHVAITEEPRWTRTLLAAVAQLDNSDDSSGGVGLGGDRAAGAGIAATTVEE